jgi:hypothetical protein
MTLFVAGYVLSLLSLAVLGYIYADYRVDKETHRAELNKKFVTDVTYVDLPEVNMNIPSSSTHSGRVRINISIEVDKKYAQKLEDYVPRITDGIIAYMQKADYDIINQPHASRYLKPYFMKIANSSSEHVPIIDIIFRQFLVL